MKYVAAFLVTVAVLYLYATRHPLPDSQLPIWIEAVGAALIFSLPLSSLSRFLTRKVPGIQARAFDLLILFFIVGLYWAISNLVSPPPKFVSPIRFWFGLTFTAWGTLFLPFVGTVAVIEWFKLPKRESPV